MGARNLLLASALAILIAGCSEAQPLAAQPAGSLNAATPTPLATERQGAATAKPKATPRATPRATAKAGSFYKPPGWDGSSDVNCKAFDTHAHAQSFFIGTGGSTSNDPYGLDGDHDGKACETLP